MRRDLGATPPIPRHGETAARTSEADTRLIMERTLIIETTLRAGPTGSLAVQAAILPGRDESPEISLVLEFSSAVKPERLADTAQVPLRRAGGRSSRMWSSLSRSGETGAGACISRSCACWFIGKATISRMFGVSASSMTMRSMPGAEPPCGGAPYLNALSMPPKRDFDLGRRIAGDRKGLVHDVRAMVADRARRQLDPVADDVVLVGERSSAGPAASSASSPPCGIENGLWLNSICPVSSFRSYIGKSTIQQNSKAPSSVRPSSRPILSRAALANGAKLFGTPQTKKTASPSSSPSLARRSRGPLRPEVPRDRAGALPVAEEDVAEPRLPFRLRPGIHLVAKGAAAAGWRRDRPHPNPRVGVDQIGEHPEAGAAKVAT